MMRLIIILVLMSITAVSQNNSDISGLWIRYDEKMLDGSKSLFTNLSDYYSIFIDDHNIGFNIDPLFRPYADIKFARKDNELITSKSSGYTFIKKTQDTLILCERIDNIATDKLKCFYLVNANVAKERKRIENQHQLTLIADPLYSPKLRKSINKSLMDVIGLSNVRNEGFSGNLILLKNSTIQVEVLESKMDETRKNKVIRELERSYSVWDLTGFEKFDKIVLPFVLKFEKESANGATFTGIILKFFTIDLANTKREKGTTLDALRKSDEYALKATKAFESGNYERAAELFKLAFEIHPKNLDYRYNQAAALFEARKRNEACEIWKELSTLEQISARQLLKENCN